MTEPEKDTLIRRYAAGDITWRALQEQGFEDYVQAPAALGERGPRQPMAAMEGQNVAARERGRAIIRAALQGRFAAAGLIESEASISADVSKAIPNG